ncbi:hypothetical protein ACFL2Q_12135, partial [Thermodesulfobacteriota bacterium]
MMKPPSTGLAALIIMICSAIAIGLLIGECGLSIMGWKPCSTPESGFLATWAEPDPVLGWRNKPGVHPVDVERRPMTILPAHVSHPFSGPEGYFSWHFLEFPRQERFEMLFRGRKEAPMDVPL